MANEILGVVVKEFITKKRQKAIIRYPSPSDIDAILFYINTISSEDTFITFSGEQQTWEEEEKFMKHIFKGIGDRNAVYLTCWIDGALAGVTAVERNTSGKKRTSHRGVFGLTVDKKFRGEGIGETLAKTALVEAKKYIEGLKIVELTVFGSNDVAKNLYLKLGFKEFGSLSKGILYHNEYIDEIQMSLTL